jgi:hypothetical protein
LGYQGLQGAWGINTGLELLGGEAEGADTTKSPAINLATRVQSSLPLSSIFIYQDAFCQIRGIGQMEMGMIDL